MKDTKIRWAEHSWNAVVGCTKISPGCDGCYAEAITKRFPRGFPEGFTPSFKPKKLGEPAKWREPARIFSNSMSDLHHADFTDDQRDQVYDMMLEVDRHDYLTLTKRPNLMRDYFNGTKNRPGYLERRGLAALPATCWIGCSIESDTYTFRTKALTTIPAVVRFLSCEPLLTGLPSLNLDGISWVVIGGESGPGYRPMDHQWARDIRDACRTAPHEPAVFFKQSAAIRTEMGMELDGERIEEYPLEHPADRQAFHHEPVVGRWVGRHAAAATPVTIKGRTPALF